jgi:hypothetical protein
MSLGAVVFGTPSFAVPSRAAQSTSVVGSGTLGLGSTVLVGAARLSESGSGIVASAASTAIGTGTVTPPGVTGVGGTASGAPEALGAGHLDEAGVVSATLVPVGNVAIGALGVAGGGDVTLAAATATGIAVTIPPGVAGVGMVASAGAQIFGLGSSSDVGDGAVTVRPSSVQGLAIATTPGALGFSDDDGGVDVAGNGAVLNGPIMAAGAGQIPPIPIIGVGGAVDGSAGTIGAGLFGTAGMTGDRLQSLIYQRGYAMTAAKAGVTYLQFRPNGPRDPMGGPALGSIAALFSQDNNVQMPNLYGNDVWHAWLDGTQTQVGDILSGTRTFFIVAQQPLLPILAVEAPRLVEILRPFHQTAFGFSPLYGGDTPAQETVVMSQWPASILQGMRGGNEDAALPDEVKAPGWNILLPAVPGILLHPSDVVVDELGRRFTIASPELTSFGWRLTTHQAES